MSEQMSGVPAGFHTMTPYLIVRDAAAMMTFMEAAFGAVETLRLAGDDGRIQHAEMQIGDSMLMLADEFAEYELMQSAQTIGGSPVSLFLYVDDADAVMQRALAAGAVQIEEVKKQYDGDRRGGVRDPFGHLWWFATQVEPITRDEIRRRFDDMSNQE